jgi:hypothetical protein
MLPTNAALLTTVPGHCQWIAEKVLKGTSTLTNNLIDISLYWKVKIWFTKPVTVYRTRFSNGYKESNVHVFTKFAMSKSNNLIYLFKRNGRYGRPFCFENLIDRYEIVFTHYREFTFEQFKAKFDPRFITNAKLQDFWNSTSAQTGKQYARSDFKQIGPEGKQLVESFLQRFKGLDDKTLVREYYQSRGRRNSRCGRDIKIEYSPGIDYVFYSSEYPGCGNGSYGILANEKQWLHLEDD